MRSEREAGPARLAVIGAAALFSTGGAAIKSCSWSAWQVAGCRSAIAALFLLLALPEARRGWSWRHFVVGFAHALTFILFVTANKLTTAANTIYLQATAPLYLLLIAPWLLHERVRRHDLLFILALAGGMAFFFAGAPPTAATAPNPTLGNLVAVASGVGWALTIAGLRWVAAHGGSTAGPAIVIGNLMAAILAAPFALPMPSPTGHDLAAIVFLGVVQIGVAYVLLSRALQRVRALEASLLLLVEPVLNPVWAFLIEGERPGSFAVIGGGIIIAATAWHAWAVQRLV